MGFNFIGIAINKNYQYKIEEVGKILEVKLTLKEEIYFETAMSSHKPDDACDIYFSEDCTIAFLAEPIQPDINSLSTDRQIASFMASENNLNLSGISSEDQLSKNLEQHCIPKEITQMDATQYEDFFNH